MMKVAIWGYGKYGRRMFESLTRFCSEEYEVVRVYDVNYRSLVSTEGKLRLQIHNPEELAEDYRNGLFEKVLLCFLWYEILIKPREFLKEHSIPELHLGNERDFYPASCFDQGKKPFDIQQEGYSFFVLKNLHGAMANYESNELLYLFNNEGKVLQEHWSHWHPFKTPHIYDYPFTFKNSKAEKIFIRGQYCILAKQSASNYWHFTYQCLDVVWLLEKAGYQGKYVVPNQSFCTELLQMLDIAPERIVPLKKFEHNKIYVFEELFCVAFFVGEEEYGASVLLQAAGYIKKKLPVNPSLPKKIYVKRVGRRKLLGADALLEEYGFTNIVPEDYSLQEQMALFYNADVVFCVHGANSTNCLYMRKGSVFIEAFSSYWMNRCNLYTVAASGVHYLPVSSLETVWENKGGIIRDYKIPDVLLRSAIQNAFLICEA
jgi:hypothetical protein